MPPRRAYRKKSKRPARKLRRKPVRRALKVTKPNAATLRENFQVSVPDGGIAFFRTLSLGDATFDRAQQVARAYQEFCIKSVKLVFRPSADTFAPAAGNSIPQLYWTMDRTSAVPTNANLQTLLDMGIKPMRFDARNIVKSYKPSVLIGADTDTVGTLGAGVLSKTSAWLATNALAGVPGTVWVPSAIEHAGCAFFVSKMAGLTPAINYTIDIQIDFAFRKPLWRAGASEEVNTNMYLTGSGVTPVVQ